MKITINFPFWSLWKGRKKIPLGSDVASLKNAPDDPQHSQQLPLALPTSRMGCRGPAAGQILLKGSCCVAELRGVSRRANGHNQAVCARQ